MKVRNLSGDAVLNVLECLPDYGNSIRKRLDISLVAVQAQLKQLENEGFIKRDTSVKLPKNIQFFRLTFKGHELLVLSRELKVYDWKVQEIRKKIEKLKEA